MALKKSTRYTRWFNKVTFSSSIWWSRFQPLQRSRSRFHLTIPQGSRFRRIASGSMPDSSVSPKLKVLFVTCSSWWFQPIIGQNGNLLQVGRGEHQKYLIPPTSFSRVNFVTQDLGDEVWITWKLVDGIFTYMKSLPFFFQDPFFSPPSAAPAEFPLDLCVWWWSGQKSKKPV